MLGEGHEWSAAGGFLALQGEGIWSDVGRCWLLLLANLGAQEEPLEAVSGVGNSEGEQRK